MWTDQRQYLRQVRVIVAPSVDPKKTSFAPVKTGEAIIFQTRTSFLVCKTNDGKPNTARISMFNLNRNSRGLLEQKKLYVWLQVGYGQTVSFTPWQTLFFGEIAFLKIVKRSGDIIADIECADGGGILRTTIVSIGLAKGCTNRQIFAEVVKQLNVTIGTTTELPIDVYKNGYTECKSAARILDDLTKKKKFKWSIQDGQLNLWPDVPTTTSEAIELTQDTGLLGLPTKIEKQPVSAELDDPKIKKIKPGPHLEGRCLLNPKIRPGSILEVSWQDVKKMHSIVEKAEFVGDSQEGPFECRFEGSIVG